MNRGANMRMLIALSLTIVALVASSGPATSNTIKTEHFVIEYEDISDDQAKAFSEKAEKAFS